MTGKLPATASEERLFLQTPRERYGRSLTVSVVCHVLLLVFLIADFGGGAEWDEQEGAGGEGPVGGGGGGGASQVEYVALPAYQRPAPAREERQTVPTRPEDIFIPQVEIEQVEIEERFDIPRDERPVDVASVLGRGAGEGGGAGAGPGSGGGIGSGQGTGIGTGQGPGTGGGDGEIYPPAPRVTAVPLDEKPSSVRGRTYEIHFWVSATGEVLRVALRPDIRDQVFRARLMDRLHEWKFNPGVRPDGTPVPAEVTVTITL